MSTRAAGTLRFAQVMVLLNGVTYLAVGAALLLAPEWFFANIGNFPPFNRHYAGDLGSFQLALGAVLLYAVRHPAAHAIVLAVAALVGTLHALNHAVDAARGLGGWDQTLALAVLAVLTLAALWQAIAARPAVAYQR
jgi:hypothetical protein